VSTELVSLLMGCYLSLAMFPWSDPLEDKRTPGGLVRAKTKPETQVELKSEPVEATLEPEGEARKGVTELVKALKPSGKLHLVLLGLGTETPPGVLYGVYLDLPPKATLDQKRSHSVGTINFFNFIGYENKEAKKSPHRRGISLDVTDVARRLQLEGKLRDNPVITIAPIGKPKPEAKPIVSEIHLIQS
jgi:hypothetical protein